jgi:flagellar export protein FliJ
MAKFRFRLQKILGLRLAAEKVAGQALATVNGQCQVLELAIVELMTRTQTSFLGRQSAGTHWSALRSFDLYAQRLALEIEAKEKALATKRVEREEKMAAYLEARKKVKTLEKLSERQLAEFSETQEHLEILRLDDLNTAAFIRKMRPLEDALG